MSSNLEVEPGAASESVLVTTDSFENFDHMSSSLEEIKILNAIAENNESNVENSNVENFDDTSENLSLNNGEDDFIQSKEWASRNKHIFVLSLAGKPIYSRLIGYLKFLFFFNLFTLGMGMRTNLLGCLVLCKH